MKNLAVAICARVSSDQQAQAQTIASQVAALRDRVTADDCVLLPEGEVIDEGYSGATLVRPGLDRLRDLCASGGVERLYVHSPDRLARKYAYQVLLIDEFQRMGIEVVFLNRELSRSPEDELLLQVQGMVAEYERAKILERSRRGKRHAAQVGNVTVMSGAPYGYRYVSKHEGGGSARYDILEAEARVVRQIFLWIGQERLSIGEVCRRLQRAEERTRTGRTQWDRSVVWGILKNPAYKGTAAFGKTRTGPLRPRLRGQRNRALQPRNAVSAYDMPREEWVFIPVPALIEEALYDTVQEQLAENRRRARQSQRGARYLLQGLLVCKVCGYAYYGKPLSPSARKPRPRGYAYYRCVGTDSYRFGGHRVCANTQIRTDLVEIVVWQEVCQLLKEPHRLEREYQRRGHARPRGAKWETPESLRAQISKLQRGMARLIDGYAEGLIEKVEFEPRIKRMKQRVTVLEDQLQLLADEAVQQRELRLLIGQLEEFVTKVQRNLAAADWEMKREIIRALVWRVEIDKEEVTVVFRVGPDPSGQSLEKKSSQHCWGREHALILVTQGYTYEEVGRILLLTEEAIRQWVTRYESHGLEGLQNHPNWGGEHGQRCLNTEQLAELGHVLQHEAMSGTPVGSGWTGKAIWQVIRERFSVNYSKSGVRKLLHLMGGSYQRGRKLYVRRRLEEQARFVLETEETLAQYAASGEPVVPLAGDQSKVYLEGTVARRWNPIGQQPLVADGARSKKAENIYGALHLGTGEEGSSFVIDWQDSEATIRWLELILEEHPDGQILLWLDQAPHHTSEEVEEWLGAHPRLTVIHFPAYTPEENPKEPTWKALKEEVSHHHWHETFADLGEAIDTYYHTVKTHTVNFLKKFGYGWNAGRLYALAS